MKPLKSIYFLTFFLSIQFAFTAYVNSTFLANFVSIKTVGLIFTLSAVLAIIGLFYIPRILAVYCNHKILFSLVSISLVSLFGLFESQTAPWVIFFFILYLLTNYLIVFSRDIFAESYTRDETTGKTRGILLTAINLGWVFAPLASGLVIKYFGYSEMYLLAAAFLFIAFIFILGPIRKLKDLSYRRIPLTETIKKMIVNKDIRKIYLANFMLQFFYAWMVIYMPIYLNQYLGFSWDKIGVIFMIMLLPFVLIEYPLGRLSDKIGERKLLIGGFLVTGIATVLISFIGNPTLAVIAAILFMTRVGAATIEIMTESYFFRKVGALDSDIISFFRNTFPLSYVIAPLLATVFFILFPFKYIFLTLGIIMLLSILIIRNLNNSNHTN
ncbi:hypothetical protein A3A09_00965 [Candidatus Nomurabacteria bacterium RIFCSPLOWO2_01_FULL_42_20]|uniref:Major facilitator superfamily (MFS) profile domain-containing protein n=1 Tax=Candidatus Nomurabacteria bacterium RIFCSPHIGHO2_01_FULL_42_16 TaxID=1801743 RepID=A0A1F6VI07_9BACT|nr:MAG: hypothetical protein A2824_01270 [Candidatus Nomurabacteria bacterium RIFCSPHIGHO2_01_FULL_42_16]OGI92532.1 MAG: hypothetical protein A3A09_00965 [Candidatus Nomurabacteria bacterium RIFCSPLOWO2_01_FULL_42_20]